MIISHYSDDLLYIHIYIYIYIHTHTHIYIYTLNCSKIYLVWSLFFLAAALDLYACFCKFSYIIS